MIHQLSDCERAAIEAACEARWLTRAAGRLGRAIEGQVGRKGMRSPEQLHRHPLVWPWFTCTGMSSVSLVVHDNAGHAALLRGLAATLAAVWPHLDEAARATVTERLQHPRRWDKTFYELRVAASYVRCGEAARILPEDPRRQTPDIAIEQVGVTVLAECKKKDLLTARDRAYQEFWKQFKAQVFALLRKARRSVSFVVVSERDPLPDDIDYLLDGIRQALRHGERGVLTDNEGFAMQWSTIAPWDAPMAGALEVGFENVDHAAIQDEIRITPLLQQTNQNAMMLGFRSNAVPDRLPGIIHSMREAAKQLPEDGPGLVYVELPLPPNERFDYEMETIVPQLQGQLERENRRINAVVLTASGQIITNTGQTIFAQRSKVVWHTNPRTPFPQGFLIPDMGVS